MTAAPVSLEHRPAVAGELVLYHVLHPTNSDRDEWTQDHVVAVALFQQFVREYGGGHLHVEIHHAGQYDAECLVRAETEAAA